MIEYLTTQQVADKIGVPIWRIRRLFEKGIMSDPVRFGRNRMIPSDHVIVISEVLREHGWLPETAEASK